MGVAGASRYLTAATLANQKGLPPSIPTALSLGNTVSLLDAGKNLGADGIGLSARSRALTSQYLSNTQGLFNSLFALGTGTSLSIEGLQTQILALRAKTPESQLSENVLADKQAKDAELEAKIEGSLEASRVETLTASIPIPQKSVLASLDKVQLRQLQALLSLQGFEVEPTGEVDSATIAALEAFQDKNNFFITGELNAETISALNELLVGRSFDIVV